MMWYLSLHTQRPNISDFEIPASYKTYLFFVFLFVHDIPNAQILSSRVLYLFCTQTTHNNYLLTKYNHAWPYLYLLFLLNSHSNTFCIVVRYDLECRRDISCRMGPSVAIQVDNTLPRSNLFGFDPHGSHPYPRKPPISPNYANSGLH